MSSTRSPDLHVELRPDPRVIGGLLLWLVAAIAGLWQAELPVSILLPATLVLLSLGLAVVSSQRFDTGRRASRLHWRADGTWHCSGANGSGEELELSPDSRVFPGGALLVFRRARSLRWALLLQPLRRPRRSLRRLCVRLALDRHKAQSKLRGLEWAPARPGAGRRRGEAVRRSVGGRR